MTYGFRFPIATYLCVVLNQNGASFPHGVADDADESVATATTPAIHDESKRPGTGEWSTEPNYV